MGVRTLYDKGLHPYSWDGSPVPGGKITVSGTNKSKGKARPRTGHDDPEGD